ncbi:hypothetical protein G2W53_025482 [Senna tora]|uniref:Uncharacterized protein n=1 Tax=Senna tora TaxID=362788 RepID=A0A834WET5_9FABA|nr:hypothetical protein G2W53_025482 [Senna tora]
MEFQPPLVKKPPVDLWERIEICGAHKGMTRPWSLVLSRNPFGRHSKGFVFLELPKEISTESLGTLTTHKNLFPLSSKPEANSLIWGTHEIDRRVVTPLFNQGSSWALFEFQEAINQDAIDAREALGALEILLVCPVGAVLERVGQIGSPERDATGDVDPLRLLVEIADERLVELGHVEEEGDDHGGGREEDEGQGVEEAVNGRHGFGDGELDLDDLLGPSGHVVFADGREEDGGEIGREGLEVGDEGRREGLEDGDDAGHVESRVEVEEPL